MRSQVSHLPEDDAGREILVQIIWDRESELEQEQKKRKIESGGEAELEQEQRTTQRQRDTESQRDQQQQHRRAGSRSERQQCPHNSDDGKKTERLSQRKTHREGDRQTERAASDSEEITSDDEDEVDAPQGDREAETQYSYCEDDHDLSGEPIAPAAGSETERDPEMQRRSLRHAPTAAAGARHKDTQKHREAPSTYSLGAASNSRRRRETDREAEPPPCSSLRAIVGPPARQSERQGTAETIDLLGSSDDE